MALIQCPECKQEISDQAPACPHCGAPRRDSVASSTPAPVTAPPARRSWGGLVVGALLLVIAVFVALRLSHARREGPTTAPAPAWIVDNVDANDSCSVLGEYCVRVRCAITNTGPVSGIAQVAVELTEDDVTVGTRRGTRSVEAGQQDTLTLDFPEANMGKDHKFRCSLVP
jgi:zinc-ribbon domain